MYLDNVIKFKSEKDLLANAVSYGDLLQSVMDSAESSTECEQAVMAAEFARIAHEGAAGDWWARLKAFFKKLWENIKKLIAKFTAWVQTIPAQLSKLWNKIMVWFTKRKLTKAFKAVQTLIANGKLTTSKDKAKSFKTTDFGNFEVDIFGDGFVDKVITAAEKESAIPADQKAVIKKIFEAIKTANGTAVEDFIKTVAKSSSTTAESLSSNAAELESLSALMFDLVTNAVESTLSKAKDVENPEPDEFIKTYGGFLENNNMLSKRYDQESAKLNKVIKTLEIMHKHTSEKFEKAYAADNKDTVAALTITLKAINILITCMIKINALLAKTYAKLEVNMVKALAAAIACYVPVMPSGKIAELVSVDVGSEKTWKVDGAEFNRDDIAKLASKIGKNLDWNDPKTIDDAVDTLKKIGVVFRVKSNDAAPADTPAAAPADTPADK